MHAKGGLPATPLQLSVQNGKTFPTAHCSLEGVHLQKSCVGCRSGLLGSTARGWRRALTAQSLFAEVAVAREKWHTKTRVYTFTCYTWCVASVELPLPATGGVTITSYHYQRQAHRTPALPGSKIAREFPLGRHRGASARERCVEYPCDSPAWQPAGRPVTLAFTCTLYD